MCTKIVTRFIFRYINDPDFNPNSIKSVSNACEGLCKWIRALDVYDKVIKIVGPKKEKLQQAETDYAVQMEKLNEKRAELSGVLSKLQTLRDELAEKTKEKKELEDNIDLCSQKLTRAEQLISGLSGEKYKWSQTALELQSTLDNAIGDVLLSAGVVAYLGAFTVDFRNVSVIINLYFKYIIHFIMYVCEFSPSLNFVQNAPKNCELKCFIYE